MKKRLFGLILLFFVHLVLVGRTGAVVLGQVDTFEDGTTMGWANGVPGALVNIDTGGPAGVDDNFLQLTADGVGAGGRLTTFNLQQWLGNYIGQGVTSIEIDLRNQGSVALSIRLAFKSQNQPNAPGYLSAPILLPIGSGWQHFSISLTAANLIPIGGPAPYATFFSSGLGDARIIHEVGATTLNGDFIVGQVGIDNIRAVPEPTTVALVVGGMLFLTACFFARARKLTR
jgi:hypothetical protein